MLWSCVGGCGCDHDEGVIVVILVAWCGGVGWYVGNSAGGVVGVNAGGVVWWCGVVRG